MHRTGERGLNKTGGQSVHHQGAVGGSVPSSRAGGELAPLQEPVYTPCYCRFPGQIPTDCGTKTLRCIGWESDLGVQARFLLNHQCYINEFLLESLSAMFSQETDNSVWNEVCPAELSDISGGGVMDKPRLFSTV